MYVHVQDMPSAAVDEEDNIINRVIGVPPSKGSKSASPQREKKLEPEIAVDINDSDDLNDERIHPQNLRRLLAERPDLCRLLYDCIVDEGLDLLEEDDGDLL